jgi:hypothetical protein
MNMDIRRRILLAVLVVGTIAGYSSGIYSAVTRDDDDRRGCNSRHRWSQHEWRGEARE